MSGSGFLLDTNTVSELQLKRPSPDVLVWFAATDDHRLHFSVLSIGEIRKGIEKLVEGGKRLALGNWLAQVLLPWFGTRVLPVDLAVAERWAQSQLPRPRRFQQPGICLGSLLHRRHR